VRWANISSEQRSEAGRRRVMVRWDRAKGGTIQKDLPGSGRMQAVADIAGVIRQIGWFPMINLGLIAKYVSDLSLKWSKLPLNDRSGRTQILTEFRFAVAQFFRARAALLERG
jgi:hypothetical protein